MKYEPRFYREQMGINRFRSFVTRYKDSDLWIGIDAESYLPEMENFARKELEKIRTELENYLLVDPEYGRSLQPYSPREDAPGMAALLAKAGNRAGTGPIAAVAGAFSEYIGKALERQFSIREIAVENGGDIYLNLEKEMTLTIFAGNSPLSGKLGIHLPGNEFPLGICTSAGTVGPSLSFGRADAAMVICKNTALADAWATSLGNQISGPGVIEEVLKKTEEFEEIESVVMICNDRVGLRGKYELKIIRQQ